MNFTYLIHLDEPVVHDLLLLRHHCTKRIEEVPRPHYLGVHNHRVYQVVCLSDELAVRISRRWGWASSESSLQM